MIRVNGEPIDPDLIDEAFHRIKSEAEALTNISCCERDEEFQRRAEDEVIDGILLAQAAERQDDEPTNDEIRDGMEVAIRRWREHGASWELLEERREAMRHEVVADLKMKSFADAVCAELPALDEEAYREWYAEHLDRYRLPAKAHGWHLVKFIAESSPEEVYRMLVGWRHEVLDGADFKALAKSHTDKLDGEIDLGWIEHQRMLHPFESIMFSLRPGEISPVIFYEQAYHLVWLEEIAPEEVKPYEEVADEVRMLASAEQRRTALAARAKELRKSAQIERG